MPSVCAPSHDETCPNCGSVLASGRGVLVTMGQNLTRNSLTEISLMWALGVILLLWIFIALRACGVIEIFRRVYS